MKELFQIEHKKQKDLHQIENKIKENTSDPLLPRLFLAKLTKRSWDDILYVYRLNFKPGLNIGESFVESLFSCVAPERKIIWHGPMLVKCKGF